MKVKLRGPQRSVAKPRLQPRALATLTALPSRERGVWSLYSEQPRGEGRARGRSEGSQGDTRPVSSLGHTLRPCLPPASFEPCSDKGIKPLQVERDLPHPDGCSESTRASDLPGGDESSSALRGTPSPTACLQSQQPDKPGDGSSDALPLGWRVKGGSQSLGPGRERLRMWLQDLKGLERSTSPGGLGGVNRLNLSSCP